MVNPIANAYNLFVGVFQSLPTPVQYFCGLAVGLILISTVVNLIFRG